MLRKSVFVFVAMALLPMSDAMAAPKKGVNCNEKARSECRGLPATSASACFRAAFDRCRKGQ